MRIKHICLATLMLTGLFCTGVHAGTYTGKDVEELVEKIESASTKQENYSQKTTGYAVLEFDHQGYDIPQKDEIKTEILIRHSHNTEDGTWRTWTSENKTKIFLGGKTVEKTETYAIQNEDGSTVVYTDNGDGWDDGVRGGDMEETGGNGVLSALMQTDPDTVILTYDPETSEYIMELDMPVPKGGEDDSAVFSARINGETYLPVEATVIQSTLSEKYTSTMTVRTEYSDWGTTVLPEAPAGAEDE